MYTIPSSLNHTPFHPSLTIKNPTSNHFPLSPSSSASSYQTIDITNPYNHLISIIIILLILLLLLPLFFPPPLRLLIVSNQRAVTPQQSSTGATIAFLPHLFLIERGRC